MIQALVQVWTLEERRECCAWLAGVKVHAPRLSINTGDAPTGTEC